MCNAHFRRGGNCAEKGGCEGITAIAGQGEGLQQNGIETWPSFQLWKAASYIHSAVAFPCEAFSLVIVQSFPLLEWHQVMTRGALREVLREALRAGRHVQGVCRVGRYNDPFPDHPELSTLVAPNACRHLVAIGPRFGCYSTGLTDCEQSRPHR